MNGCIIQKFNLNIVCDLCIVIYFFPKWQVFDSHTGKYCSDFLFCLGHDQPFS